MFIIAGISPKTKIVDNTPRICPACGLAQARLKRVDSYFNLFFIPLIRVKKGEPFLECDRCGSFSAQSKEAAFGAPSGADRSCPQCGQPLGPDYRYCPFCGKALS